MDNGLKNLTELYEAEKNLPPEYWKEHNKKQREIDKRKGIL